MYKKIFINHKSVLVFLLSVIIIYGFLLSNPSEAAVFRRRVPSVREIQLPDDIHISSEPCPDLPGLPGHISICGRVTSIDISKSGPNKNVEYAQMPVNHATVAVYLGPDRWKNIKNWPFTDLNKTGELVGKIEGLYMYDVTNEDGRFILGVPRGKGVNGYAFLAFFCNDILKDLYMIDTTGPTSPGSSRYRVVLPTISLSCVPGKTHTYNPGYSPPIPAPPSINYFDRESYLGCEKNANHPEASLGGMVYENNPDNTLIDLLGRSLDDTHIGAIVTQQMCDSSATWVMDPLTGNLSCELSGDTRPCGPANFPPPSTRVPDTVPESIQILSQRDLEGYTHTSMGYSQQAISSMNCGMAGCYDTGAPVYFDDDHTILDKDIVRKCNTSWPMPLYCYGPGIETAAPGWYEASYNRQNPQIYNGFVIPGLGAITGRLWGITLPGHATWLFDRGSEYFPYSTVLNYEINGYMLNTVENRPQNDSYFNESPSSWNYCSSTEQTRLYSPWDPPLTNIADHPFDACYASILLGDDTYSTKKLLYMMTVNTNLYRTGHINQVFYDPDGPTDQLQQPPVANFYGPGEEIGVDVSHPTEARDNGISHLQKIGDGFWRLGVVQTLCTVGTPDSPRSSRRWPFTALYGAESPANLYRARPLP